jgi:MYXO-CTERM domain-containing protein
VVAPAVAVAPGAPLEALVVWQDVTGIQSALLGPSGVVTRRSALAPGSRPAVAWSQGAGAFLVVWETTGPVRGALVQRNGTTTFLNFFEVGTEPAVACGPLECLVAYLKGSEVKVQPVGALVTSNMPPVTVAPGGSTFGGRRSPAIALADTTGYVVVWVEPTANNGLVAFRSETMPSVFSPVTLPALPSGLKGEPALACDSARCSLVFTISNPAPNRAMHVSFALTSGSSPPSDLTPGVSRVSGPAVVNGPSSGATPRLVAWTEQRLVQSDIMGRLVLGDALGAAFPISVGAATQRSVALSAGANETTLAVWTDSRVDEGDVYGRVLLLDGGALGPSFSIATGPGPQLAPSAAWNGVEWLVLFIDKDNSRVQARAVTAAGLVAGGPPSLIATALDDVDSQTSVAAVGRQFFATWLQTSASVFGARITPGAPAVVEPLGRPLTPAGAASCTATSVASNGSAWLAAWTCASELTAAEVFVDGGLANPVRIASPAEAPSVVFGDGRYLLVWAESRMTGPNILGRFWPTGATIQPPFSIETAPRERSRPAAAFSDWGFVTTWRERQALRFDVVGARLVDGGVQRFSVAALERVEEAGAAIACPAAGRCLVGGGVSAVGASRAVRALRNDVRNAVPVAMGATIAVQGRTPVRVRAVDADDEALTIAFDAGTLQAGALEETDEGWFYVPRAGASGTDVASFTASDGVDRSEPALVTFSLVGAAGGGAGGGGDGAGVVTDGGLETPPVVVFAPSCGCVSGDGLAWWLAVLAFAARRRRNGRGSTAG